MEKSFSVKKAGQKSRLQPSQLRQMSPEELHVEVARLFSDKIAYIDPKNPLHLVRPPRDILSVYFKEIERDDRHDSGIRY